MFLSKLCLNLRNYRARRDLAQPYEMHRTLWRAFPEGDPGRVLFRVDTSRLGAQSVVLVQSDHGPDWARLPDSAYTLAAPEVKPLDALSFSPGQLLRFRLRANPTKRVASANERLGTVMAGKRVALQTEADQLAWLDRKAEAGGFRLPHGTPSSPDGEDVPRPRVDLTPEGWVQTGRGGRLLAVRFDGVLQVVDPASFRVTLADGIGSAKGFGFGLLSVSPAH